jgi:hypothetical protein
MEAVRSSPDTSQSPDDEKILKYAIELFRRLGITRPEPNSVVWDADVSPDLATVRLAKVTLPTRMMGRLTAEDWKPLLASAIIYRYVLSRDKNRGTLTRILLPIGLAEIPLAFTLIQIFRLSSQADTRGLLLTTIILWIAYSSALVALYIRWFWRGLTYVADRRAASTIGRDQLLAAFAKYRDAISATGYPRKRLHLWPTVGQRIERVQKDLR